MISIWKLDPFPQKKEFTLELLLSNSSFPLLAFLGSPRAHTHTQSQISWHQISKTPLLSNLTNFKTNITKSMHGMRCTTSPKRARKTHYYRQDKREDESTPFLCEVWINTLLLLGLRNCHKGTDAISMITKEKGEAPSERNYFLTKCNKGKMVIGFFSYSSLAKELVAIAMKLFTYSIVFFHHLLNGWKKHTHIN